MKEAESIGVTEDLTTAVTLPPPPASRKSLLFMVIIGAQLLIIIVVGSLMIRTIPSSPHFLQHFMARTAIGQAGGFEMDKNVTMDWHKLSNRMEHLNMNPVYASLGIPRKIVRPVVNLLLIVSSAPSRIERRMAIRDTWWNQSTTNDKVKIFCLFLFHSWSVYLKYIGTFIDVL